MLQWEKCLDFYRKLFYFSSLKHHPLEIKTEVPNLQTTLQITHRGLPTYIHIVHLVLIPLPPTTFSEKIRTEAWQGILLRRPLQPSRAKVNHQADTKLLLLVVTCWGCNMLGCNMQADWGLDRYAQGERDGRGDWDGRVAWIREKKIALTMKT